MKRLFLLSKENVNLAQAEVLALSKSTGFEIFQNLLIADAPDLSKRLALTHSVFRFLFEASFKDLDNELDTFSFGRYYRKSFAVRVMSFCGDKFDARFFAGRIWHRIKDPKVDLKSPDSLFTFFILPKKVICALHESDIDTSYMQRRPHLRPVYVPTSMHPRLARALVNLTGIRKGKILDPFCGSGGILIEAGLIGLIPIGYDIDERLLKLAENNLVHYKIRDFKFRHRDALTIPKSDYIVTDLPYGRSSKLSAPLLDLYRRFLQRLKQSLKKKAVIVFPHFVDAKGLIRDSGLRIEHQFRIYVHKSLSRDVFVVENDI